MHIKQTLICFLDILLRVPSLFILDEVFQSGIADLGLYPFLLLPLHKENDFDAATGESNHTLLIPHHSVANYNSAFFGNNLSQNLVSVIEYDVSSPLFNYLNKIINCSKPICTVGLQIAILYIAFCVSLFTLTLWTKHLVQAYKSVFSLSLVMLSQRFNQMTFAYLSTIFVFDSASSLDGKAIINTITLVIGNVMCQLLFASSYVVLVHSGTLFSHNLQRILVLSFLLPSFTLMLPLEKNLFSQECFCILIIHYLGVQLFNLKTVFRAVQERIHYIVSCIRNEGTMAFTEAEWLRLDIPLIFRSFWLLRCGIHIYVYLAASETDTWADTANLKILVKILLIRGCETLPAILGMSSIFSWIYFKVYEMCQSLMMVPHDESSHIGSVAGILLWILSFQYGLSLLKPAQRLVRLERIIILISACFLHFFHNAVDTVLMSLAASGNLDFDRHAKTLLVSGLLSLVASSGLYCLWTTHSISTWLLAVSGFSVEAICKNTISLALYFLFLQDSWHQECWDKLDDYVYRLKFTGRVVELLLGFFMLSNSGYALIYESGGFVRATLFGLQGYFNLWGEARVGWKIFTCRRTAVRKIATLETVDKLDKLDDVCAICYHNLKPSTTNQVTIKVTRCFHYYHAVCLRKWLYVQDRCPMCHQTLWPELRTSHVERVSLHHEEYEDFLHEQ